MCLSSLMMRSFVFRPASSAGDSGNTNFILAPFAAVFVMTCAPRAGLTPNLLENLGSLDDLLLFLSFEIISFDETSGSQY